MPNRIFWLPPLQELCQRDFYIAATHFSKKNNAPRACRFYVIATVAEHLSMSACAVCDSAARSADADLEDFYIRSVSIPSSCEGVRVLALVKDAGSAFAMCALATLVCLPFSQSLDLANIALAYTLTTVTVAAKIGRRSAILSAVLGSLAFAYFFVPPNFSLFITELRYILTALGMLLVALLVGHLTANLKTQLEVLRNREADAKALYELAESLAGVLSANDVVAHLETFLCAVLNTDCHVSLQSVAGGADALPVGGASPLRTAPAMGLSTLRIPVVQAGGNETIVIETADEVFAEAHHRQLIETATHVAAVALGRMRLAEIARESDARVADERLRSSILAALSHDLQTPLTALIGAADALALGRTPPERLPAMIVGIRDQARAISRLITNLLDMARLRSGSVALQREWQPVEEVVGSSLEILRAQLGGREVGVLIDPQLPPLRFDAVLIERVLCNLIENAIKYSPAGSAIEIAVRGVGETAEFSVSDAGCGLAADLDRDLFEMFVRGDAESAIPGAGLGLSIARAIIEAHAGRIWAEARQPRGTTFRFALPLSPLPDMGLAEAKENLHG